LRLLANVGSANLADTEGVRQSRRHQKWLCGSALQQRPAGRRPKNRATMLHVARNRSSKKQNSVPHCGRVLLREDGVRVAL